jgi:hypothetical protein
MNALFYVSNAAVVDVFGTLTRPIMKDEKP